MPISLVYFGAPSFSARVLESILSSSNLPIVVSGIVTQPDRPAGRKQILTPTPVKLCGQEYKIPVFESSNSEAVRKLLSKTDLVLLYAFGELLNSDILKLPRWGFWNIHPSLLPKYRGTSPIAYSLLMGDKTTGVSLMQMDEKMDHGPIIDQQTYEMNENETRETLENRLSDIGYELFKKNIQLLTDGLLQKTEQNHINRTFTRLLTKKDGFIPSAIFRKIIDDERPVKDEIPPMIAQYLNKYNLPLDPYMKLRSYYLLFRALNPWPGLWTLLAINGVEKRLKIRDMKLKNDKPVITKVQLEGKKEVDFETFNKAYTIF